MSKATEPADPHDVAGLRRCLGRFATGVTVVTCVDAQGHPCGITVNSFSSVSLEPPLVLWNVAKVTHSLQAFLGAGRFAINVLGAGQEEISTHFAQSDHTLFGGIDYTASADGVPLLADTIACLQCRTHRIHDCGDHYIIIGEVLAYDCDDRDPLLFFGGDYRKLAR